VRELLLLYRETLFDSKGIAVEVILPREAIGIACDRDSTKQILLNLWKNASEALAGGQHFRLTLTDGIRHQGRHFAELRIDDNGPGMSEVVMQRPASPRQRWHRGATRGMGLSIVGTLTQQTAEFRSPAAATAGLWYHDRRYCLPMLEPSEATKAARHTRPH
jgi:signal transduction histidine kinase